MVMLIKRQEMNVSKPDSSEAGPSTSEGVQTTETPPAGPSAMLVDATPQIPEVCALGFCYLDQRLNSAMTLAAAQTA